MKPRKMKLDNSTQFNARHWNKQHIEEMSKKLILYYSDPDKKLRTKEKHLCRYCNYVNTSRIGGSMITTVICANCDEEMIFSNTCVDILCNKCAEELKVCKRCGQKMD